MNRVGGWFSMTAAEMFTLSERDFCLPGWAWIATNCRPCWKSPNDSGLRGRRAAISDCYRSGRDCLFEQPA